MQSKKLFNPYFGEDFEVGKEVEHIMDFEYIPNSYENLKTYFDYKKNSNELLEREVDEIYNAFKIIRDSFIMPENNYKLHKEFFSDFISVLKKHISEIENNREIYDYVLNSLQNSGVFVYGYINYLQEKGIDLYPVYVRTLKNIVSDLESRAKQLFQNLDSDGINNIMDELSKQIYSSETDIEIKTLDLFLELLRDGKFNNIVNLFTKQIFPSIYMEKFNDWYMNKPNWFTKILANEFTNKIKKSGVDIREEELNLFSIRLLTEIWNRDELYFDDKDRYKLFFDTFRKNNRKIDRFTKLFFNPDVLKYIHPEFIKQFKDFDDFIQNSGITKDGDYFSTFYFFSMLYNYDTQSTTLSEDVSNSFIRVTKKSLPIQKNHIRNYIDIQSLSLYRLKPTFITKNTSYYNRELLIKYFGVSNLESCVRVGLTNETQKGFGVSKNVNFILLADKNGNTVGRFIDVGDDIITNLHYNKMAYETAFRMGGEEIIKNYLTEYKNLGDDFELEYEDLTHNAISDKGELIKHNIKEHMKEMKNVFHVNDYVKIKKK